MVTFFAKESRKRHKMWTALAVKSWHGWAQGLHETNHRNPQKCPKHPISLKSWKIEESENAQPHKFLVPNMLSTKRDFFWKIAWQTNHWKSDNPTSCGRKKVNRKIPNNPQMTDLWAGTYHDWRKNTKPRHSAAESWGKSFSGSARQQFCHLQKLPLHQMFRLLENDFNSVTNGKRRQNVSPALREDTA